MEQALWAKHIADDIRQRVLDEVDDSEYKSVLADLLKSKRRSIKAATDYELNMKLNKFALSRGFDYSIVRQCIDCDDYAEEDSETDFWLLPSASLCSLQLTSPRWRDHCLQP